MIRRVFQIDSFVHTDEVDEEKASDEVWADMETGFHVFRCYRRDEGIAYYAFDRFELAEGYRLIGEAEE